MYSHEALNKAIAERGARYIVTGTIRTGEFAYDYADSGERAEKIRVDYEETWRYHQVRIIPPEADMDLAHELETLGQERKRLRSAEREVTARLRATSIRAHEHEFAEADIARRANIDRMTVRDWLGKR